MVHANIKHLVDTALDSTNIWCNAQSVYWKQYAEVEMAVGTPATVKAVFSRCLLSCLHADLWRVYLRFIKKVSRVNPAAHAPMSLCC